MIGTHAFLSLVQSLTSIEAGLSDLQEPAAISDAAADHEALQHWISKLDGKQKERQEASEAIRSRGKAALPALLKNISDPNEQTALQCVYLASQIGVGDSQVLDTLVSYLKPAAPRLVQEEILAAFSRWQEAAADAGPHLYEYILVSSPVFQDRAIAVLARLGIRAAPLLAELMRHSERRIRFTSAKACQRLGYAALPHLLPLVEHPDWRIRHDVCYALYACWDKRQAPNLLSQLLEDKNEAVRITAMWQLYLGLAQNIRTAQDPDQSFDTPELLEVHLEEANPWTRYSALSNKRRLLQHEDGKWHGRPHWSEKEKQLRQKLDQQLERQAAYAQAYLIQELRREQDPTRMQILVEWLGSMGSHAQGARATLQQLRRDQRSFLIKTIDQTLEQIEASTASSSGSNLKNNLTKPAFL